MPPAAEHRRGVVEWVVVRVVVVQVQERQQMASAEVVQPLEERQGRPALEEVRTMSVSGRWERALGVATAEELLELQAL